MTLRADPQASKEARAHRRSGAARAVRELEDASTTLRK